MKKILILFCFIMVLVGCKEVKLNDGENAIITFKEGGISAEDLYEKLKNSYGAETVTDLIDKYLLDSLYETTAEEKEYIKQSIKAAKSSAEQMNVNLETYIYYYYNTPTENAFKDFISLNYKRNLWIEDYAIESVTEKQIKEYYKDYVTGDMEVSHIQITSEATDNMSEEDIKKAEEKALNEAKEIIKKLKEGKKFSDLAKEYSDDKASANNGGSLGKINHEYTVQEILNEAKKLKEGEYSASPIKSSYGYHIVYKTSQTEKPELDEKLTESIKKIVGKEISEDSSFYIKAVKALREKNEMKFIDTELEKEYQNLLNRTEASYNSNNN